MRCLLNPIRAARVVSSKDLSDSSPGVATQLVEGIHEYLDPSLCLRSIVLVDLLRCRGRRLTRNFWKPLGIVLPISVFQPLSELEIYHLLPLTVALLSALLSGLFLTLTYGNISECSS